MLHVVLLDLSVTRARHFERHCVRGMQPLLNNLRSDPRFLGVFEPRSGRARQDIYLLQPQGGFCGRRPARFCSADKEAPGDFVSSEFLSRTPPRPAEPAPPRYHASEALLTESLGSLRIVTDTGAQADISASAQ